MGLPLKLLTVLGELATTKYFMSVSLRNLVSLSACVFCGLFQLPSSTAAPETPAIYQSQNSNGAVVLQWSNPGNVASYVVERRKGPRRWQLLGSLPGEAIGFVDAAVSRRTKYNYRVRATDGSGGAATSNVVAVTTMRKVPSAAAGRRQASGALLPNSSESLAGPTGTARLTAGSQPVGSQQASSGGTLQIGNGSWNSNGSWGGSGLVGGTFVAYPIYGFGSGSHMLLGGGSVIYGSTPAT